MTPYFSCTADSLTQSSLLLLPTAAWEGVVAEARTQTHAADLWVPEDLLKPVSVADVRALGLFLSRTRVGQFRMAVIPSADRLSQESANALLKMLEEPPEGVWIVLLAETRRLLPTVLSRVGILAVAPDLAIMEARQSGQAAPWRRALEGYRLDNPVEREQALRLLYLYPLAHQGIKPESLIDTYLPPS